MHKQNYGYGANQKTCYAEALKAKADIVDGAPGLSI